MEASAVALRGYIFSSKQCFKLLHVMLVGFHLIFINVNYNCWNVSYKIKSPNVLHYRVSKAYLPSSQFCTSKDCIFRSSYKICIRYSCYAWKVLAWQCKQFHIDLSYNSLLKKNWKSHISSNVCVFSPNFVVILV